MSLNVLGIQLFVHTHKQLLGFGIHIAHIHTPFMVEQDVVSFPGSIDAHVELLRLTVGDEGFNEKVLEEAFGLADSGFMSQARF